MKTFYNTTQLTGEALKEAVWKAANQDNAILMIYLNARRPFSPSQILALCEKAGKKYPITSIRRTITNLCSAGHLVKTTETVKGMYGSMEHRWQINAIKYPSQIASQTNLFNQQENAA